MRIAILSRGQNLHSTRRLVAEAKRLRVQCDIINPLECQLVVDGKMSRVMRGLQVLPAYDAVLPRIGASITSYGLSVLRQFETLGTHSINTSGAIAKSRDKMWCLQALAGAGLQVPATVLTRSPRGFQALLQAVRGFPTVLKTLQGTQGLGVMLLHTPIGLKTVLDAFWNMEVDVLIQQFLSAGAGWDVRAFVIQDRVVAAMLRTAPQGEFRSNIHRGGEGRLVKLPREFERAALRAVKELGLEIAGVDLMEGGSGPVVVEVNSSPGFEGIEKATGQNIARLVVQHIVRSTRIARKSNKSKKKSDS